MMPNNQLSESALHHELLMAYVALAKVKHLLLRGQGDSVKEAAEIIKAAQERINKL